MLSRRGFLGGVVAAVAARCLPNLKVVPSEPPLDMSAVRWNMFVYGTCVVRVVGDGSNRVAQHLNLLEFNT